MLNCGAPLCVFKGPSRLYTTKFRVPSCSLHVPSCELEFPRVNSSSLV